jgi:hypothetical protein
MNQANSSGVTARAFWTFAAGGSFDFQYPAGIVLSSGSDVSVNGVTPPFQEAMLIRLSRHLSVIGALRRNKCREQGWFIAI